MSTQWLPGDRTERWVFMGLLVLATVLRLWNLPNLPFAHDELSALLRLYPSLGQTIHGGVMIGDTHPPGVQVFLWCWTNLFGTSEVAVKLPFILLSVVALFYWYRVASAWAGVQAALLITALLATAQYTVMYGQLARPYAFGFFSVGLMADQLVRFAADGRRAHLVGFVAGAVLSAYAHHFALLTAALLACAGLWLVPRGHRRGFLLACTLAVLLYAPNVIITLHQMGMGGLASWLHPPSATWIPDYLAWVVMYSVPLMACVAALVVWSLFQLARHNGLGERLFWTSLLLGVAPLAIGYAYSVQRAPVLQYSVLIFSFPFLLIALFMGLKALPRGITIGACAVLAGLSVSALVRDRQHYTLLYNSRYEAYAEAMASAGPQDLVIIDAQSAMLEHYLDKWKLNAGANTFTVSQFDSLEKVVRLLANEELRTATIGFAPNSPPDLLAVVQERFPVVERVEHFCEGSLYRFVKSGVDDHSMAYSTAKPWSDSTVVEFPAILEAKVGDVCTDANALFEVRAVLPRSAPDPAELELELYDGGAFVGWFGAPKWAGLPRPDGSRTLHLAFRASEHDAFVQNLRVRMFLRNKTGRWLGTPGLSYRGRPGNPVLYGLYAPVPR
ncbi:MAG: glycosyltransferase family 39 protein [Flavobacteriales bacterium]|nr:MAG: glycosyltransferase family 39 protein [Flavobacteriales bacterium]